MSTSYETKTIEHLGLVAGMYDELGVGELIDQLISQDFEQRQVTIGQAVKASQSSWTNGGDPASLVG